MEFRSISEILIDADNTTKVGELLLLGLELEGNQSKYPEHEFKFAIERIAAKASSITNNFIEEEKHRELKRWINRHLQNWNTTLKNFNNSITEAAIAMQNLNWAFEDFIDKTVEKDAQKGIDSVNDFLN